MSNPAPQTSAALDSAIAAVAPAKRPPPPRLTPARTRLDLGTVIGAIAAFALVAVAILLGGSSEAFVSWPALLIVFGGTIAVATLSSTGEDLAMLLAAPLKATVIETQEPRHLARQLVKISDYARRVGRVSLADAARDMGATGPLRRLLGLVSDGLTDTEAVKILRDELDTARARHERAAQVLRRAAEIAPAMGLIGTLVGLVQMLSRLNTPETIGPAMALALLTTLYGAILGTLLLGPLAAKLDRRAEGEALNHRLLLVATGSLARQENPRRLEILLNAVLPPDQRLRLYD